MKRYNDYFTLLFVTFLTLFSFFHMSTIVDVSHDVITIVFKNLLPSLLPFMILVSLCLNLGILDILAYFLQKPFYALFSLTPMMSSLYFVSFFCGYPTNVKIIKEAYELNYIDLDELQHLLSIASFSSISFIFICHLLPSLILASFYHHPQKKLTFKQVLQTLKQPHLSFVKAFKKSVLSSVYAFLFILGYMLIFQFFVSFLQDVFPQFSFDYLKGILEFSSGSLKIIHQSKKMLPFVCFFLSFSGFSVMMQADNLLEAIPYSFKKYFLSRLYHGILSFILCLLFLQFGLI